MNGRDLLNLPVLEPEAVGKDGSARLRSVRAGGSVEILPPAAHMQSAQPSIAGGGEKAGGVAEYRIGIDPGCSGAIVGISPDGSIHSAELMPTFKNGKSTRVNGAALAAFLAKFKGVSHAYIEAVHAMPKQGVTSVFTFGHAAGVAEGILQGLGIPYTLVPPQTWKKRAGLIGQDKDAARSRAIQLWPDWRDLDKKGKGQAFADAALIARYGVDIREAA